MSTRVRVGASAPSHGPTRGSRISVSCSKGRDLHANSLSRTRCAYRIDFRLQLVRLFLIVIACFDQLRVFDAHVRDELVSNGGGSGSPGRKGWAPDRARRRLTHALVSRSKELGVFTGFGFYVSVLSLEVPLDAVLTSGFSAQVCSSFAYESGKSARQYSASPRWERVPVRPS